MERESKCLTRSGRRLLADYIWAMSGKNVMRKLAWLLMAGLCILLLERGLPHHCADDAHHTEAGTNSLTQDCVLCDMAPPVYQPSVALSAPLLACVEGPLPVFRLASIRVEPHGAIPPRGPPSV